MKFIIHYNKDFEDDSFIVEADTIQEIKTKTFEELNKRNIDANKNYCWSEAI